MSLPLEREEIQRITEELEVIIAAHLAWFKQMNRTLVCGGPINQTDLDSDAHLRSPFGQWYYSQEPYLLEASPDYQGLGAIQQSMHESARVALLSIIDQRRPAPELYDQCIDLALRLNTTLRRLQLDIIGELLTTDSLTGCATRRGMMQRLREEQERSLRIQRPCCLCLLDFDRFKRINDGYGHLTGDQVLRESSARMQMSVRAYDAVGRYGGEEFLIVLPGCDAVATEQQAERIRRVIASSPIPTCTGEIRLTASVGATVAVESDYATNPERMLRTADLALYDAKGRGRNCVTFRRLHYVPEPEPETESFLSA